jgi:DNA-binding CsgD family transcriptional regulator/PAS domain-containing protein
MDCLRSCRGGTASTAPPGWGPLDGQRWLQREGVRRVTADVGRGGHRSPTEDVGGNAEDIHQALLGCDCPMIVWELPAGTVLLANPSAAELFGIPLDRLVGTPADQLLTPVEAVRRTIAMVASGTLDDVHAERLIPSPSGEGTAVRAWIRSITVDGARAAVSLLVRVDEVGRLGRDPATPWRDLLAVAVGIADRRLHVRVVSDDIRGAMGIEPEAIVGRSLTEVLGLEVDALLNADSDSTVSHFHARADRHGAPTIHGCVLLARSTREPADRVAFAIIGAPAELPSAAIHRVAELERRLRVIGAEVRAARVLEHVDNLPSLDDHPALRGLTTRQWDILSRLLQGDRPTTIAADLFISATTVRNHLSTIFRKFGVHSQAELLAAFRKPSTA